MTTSEKPKIADLHHVMDPAYFRTTSAEVALFDSLLRSFVPPQSFDIHAHLYEPAGLAQGYALDSDAPPVGYDTYLKQQRLWMGDLAPTQGLFFPYPAPKLDVGAANDYLHGELAQQPQSRGLMLIGPADEPALVEKRVREQNWSGFKVYHLLATSRPDTSNCTIDEFLPEWAWEIAQRHGLAITLHMVRQRALADRDNQRYIRSHCIQYPNAKLILAHAARGFCAAHTVESIDSIRGLENVYFDTSAICEAPAFEAIIETFGPTRLLYGSDFPVSEARGRCISLGDHFHWIYEWDRDSWPMGPPVLIGIESLLALRQACKRMALTDADIERIFSLNARELLGVD